MGATAADLGQIPMSPDLGATLARGAEYSASAGAPEVTLEHLLAGLCDDPDAIAVLDASQVNVAALKDDVVSRFTVAAGPHPPPGDFGVSQSVRRILEAAAAAARGSRRRDINGAIVLAAIVGDARSMAAEILQGHGLTFDGAIRALQTALAPAPAPARAAAPPQPPVTDDVLARARERVQSRSAPSLHDIMKDMPRPVPPPPRAAPTDDTDEDGTTPDHGAGHEAPSSLPPGEVHDTHQRTGMPSPQATPRQNQRYTEEPSRPQAPAPQSSAPSRHELDNSEPQRGTPSVPQSAGEQSTPAPEHVRPAAPRSEPSLSFPGAPPNRGGEHAANPERAFPSGPATHPAAQAPPPRGFPIDLPRPIPHGAHPPPIPPSGPMPSAVPGPPGMRGPGPSFGPPGSPSHGPFHGQQPEPGFGSPDRPGSLSTDTGLHADAKLDGPLAPGAPASARSLQRASVSATRTPARKRGKRAKVEAGQMAENIPRSMRVGRTERVEVRIAKASIPALTEGLDGNGLPRQHQIAITKAMSVRIRAPEGGFFIETASPETQWIENGLDLEGDDFASWRFLITPQARGWSTLQIVVSARTIGAEGIAAETALPDQVVEVKVRRNLKRTFARLFGWSTAAILGGALATLGEGGLAGVMSLLQRLLH